MTCCVSRQQSATLQHAGLRTKCSPLVRWWFGQRAALERWRSWEEHPQPALLSTRLLCPQGASPGKHSNSPEVTGQ